MKLNIKQVLKEAQKDDKSPKNAVKNDYKFLPIFQNNQVSKVQNLEKTAIFTNLFNLKKQSAKLMLLQIWVYFVRYILPLFALLILSQIESKELSDVYFYSNSVGILVCLYLIFKIDTIKNFSQKVTILIFATFSFSTLFNLSVGIFSVDRFMYHFSYSVTFFLILFFLVKDIFIDSNFSKIWFFDKNFYLVKSTQNLSKLKKTLVVFFTISAISMSFTTAYMGYLVTFKKIEIAQKLSNKE